MNIKENTFKLLNYIDKNILRISGTIMIYLLAMVVSVFTGQNEISRMMFDVFAFIMLSIVIGVLSFIAIAFIIHGNCLFDDYDDNGN